jgi:hypothetical membrane protein
MTRIAGSLGIVSALMGLAFPIYFAALDPSYDSARNFISELGAAGAPNAALVNWYGFLPTGIVQCGFALFAWLALPRSSFTTLGLLGIFFFAIGYVGAAFFPCDAGCRPEDPSFSQTMHNLTGLLGYLGAPLFMAILAFASSRWPNGSWLAVIAGVGALGSAYGLSGLFDEASGLAGQAQRILEFSVLAWILAAGCYLLAGGPSAMRAAAGR